MAISAPGRPPCASCGKSAAGEDGWCEDCRAIRGCAHRWTPRLIDCDAGRDVVIVCLVCGADYDLVNPET
jgi:hypothetical protein